MGSSQDSRARSLADLPVPLPSGSRPPDQRRLLIVDGDEKVARLYSQLFTEDGYTVAIAPDGPMAIAMVVADPPDAVILDVELPGYDGLEICRRLKRETATRLTPVVLLAGLAGGDRRLEALEAGADEFLTKPADTDVLLVRIRALVRLKRYTDDLDSAASIIETLAVMIEVRDGNTEGHCYRMANYATALGRRIGLGSEELQALHRGGFLHDIGMLAIPDAVLRKSGPLEPEEYELIKAHTVIGESLCGNLRSLRAVRPIVRHHHERLDGSGYPDGLVGDAVPLLAQIVGVVDVFVAMTSKRAYQAARSIDETISVLNQQVSRGWRRADLVREFFTLLDDGKLG